MNLLLMVALGGAACVIDRTGQSAVTGWKRELALQEAQQGDFERRLALLESSIRARGRHEAESMEDLEGVRAEVRRLRGELELAQHKVQGLEGLAGAVRDESDIRLEGLERRLTEVELLLGQEVPPTAVAVDPESAVSVPTVPAAGNPDALLELAQEHLTAGRAVAARAVLTRYVEENPQSPRALEGRFLMAETWFAESSFQQAVLAYEDVIRLEPTGPWAPRAMLRQGECFQAMGRAEEARLFWEDLVAKYPRSDEAMRARARLERR